MTFLDRILDVFSKREGKSKSTHHIPETTRHRILMWCNERFVVQGDYGEGGGDYRQELWKELYRRLSYRLGRARLSGGGQAETLGQEVMRYVLSCPGAEFLDVVEDIFQTATFQRLSSEAKPIVEEIRSIFRADGLPYSLTDLVTETVKVDPASVPLPFSPGNVFRTNTLAYPKVIMRDNEAAYVSAVGPALELLTRPHFKHANEEYVAAHEDYRKGEYRDALTKCASAFESVLKVCCARKRWPYQETDTAKALTNIFFERTKLDRYFEPALMVVATLRNRLSSAHGAGTNPKVVPQHLAHFALNATATAILLVVEELGEK